jgi:hypothetical protein
VVQLQRVALLRLVDCRRQRGVLLQQAALLLRVDGRLQPVG